jgi:CheY-like chemotaxis protein
MKVLVAEDDDGIRGMLVAELEDAGYEVTEAADGAAVLELLKAGPRIDALVTDIRMSGAMGGKSPRLTGSVFQTCTSCM